MLGFRAQGPGFGGTSAKEGLGFRVMLGFGARGPGFGVSFGFG